VSNKGRGFQHLGYDIYDRLISTSFSPIELLFLLLNLI